MVTARRASALPPSAITTPLTRQLVAVIGDRWNHSGDFADIADAVVDLVAEHIRRHGIRGAIDARIAHAIADVISDHTDRAHAAAEVPGQLTLDDALRAAAEDFAPATSCRACSRAQASGDLGWCGVCGATWGYR